MPQHQNTPILEVRPLSVATVVTGDLLACHTPTGTYPYQVRAIDHHDGHSTMTLAEVGSASGLARLVTITTEDDTQVKALPQHFGVCRLCGRLSPCPDELDERCLERLFDTSTHPDDPAPNNQAPNNQDPSNSAEDNADPGDTGLEPSPTAGQAPHRSRGGSHRATSRVRPRGIDEPATGTSR